MKDIAVIGGGASGLMAACLAAEREGNRVHLFEKQKKTGRKILVTGNGRCNISNRNLHPSRYHGHNPRFVNNIFGRYGLQQTIDFFQSIGLPFTEEDEGKLFPASLQALTVMRLFEYELERRGVTVHLHRRVDHVYPGRQGEPVTIVTAGREEYRFDAVILACGSCAFGPVGASRSGYELAASLGHTVHEPFPAILPLNIPVKALHRLQGIRWDCTLEVLVDGKTVDQSTGEVLFAKYGISGPASLAVSRSVNQAVLEGRDVAIMLNIFPYMDRDEFMNTVQLLWQDGKKPLSLSLMGIMHSRMPEVFLSMAGIDHEKKVAEVGKAERERVADAFLAYRLEPGKPRPFTEAVVAAGGVDVNEINPATMESKKAPGVHITGELLDIDGDSGGFNLQFAWSTGAIAGMAQW